MPKFLYILGGLCLLLALGTSWAADPPLRVVPVYEGQRAFLQAARAAPDATILELHRFYRELALAPYAEACADGNMAGFSQSYTYLSRVYESAWAEAIDKISAAEVEVAVREVVAAASRQLRADPVIVCILALPPNDRFVIDKMGGVTGSASGSFIHLQIYPTEGWLAKVRHTVAHEYHHVVWFQRFPDWTDTFTLLDNLVLEGRADSFAEMIYPGAAAPWTDALTAEQEGREWSLLQPLMTSSDYELIAQVMFGGGGYPT